MISVVYVDGLHGVNYHRLIIPLKRLQEQGHFFHWIDSLKGLAELDLEKVDYLIVSRKLNVEDHSLFRKILDKYDVKLILDNDDYWELESHNAARELYFRYFAKEIKGTIKIADIIWSPSHILIKEMRRLNPKAEYHYVPNGIDPDDPQWDIQKIPSEEVRFGYLGAMGHGKDLDLMGYDFSGKEMYSVMLEDYPDRLGAKYVMSPSDTFSYGRAYEYFDVSLVPLNNTKFNNCKSDLKISEAGFSKTAVIASNVTPYKQVIEHGVTGILVNDKGEWKEAIESMTKPEANRLAKNLYEYCVEHYHIDKLNQIRINSMIK